MNRNLYKVKFQNSPIAAEEVARYRQNIRERLGIDESAASYLAFTGEAENRTYNPFDEKIHILFKDGQVRDISQVDNALIQHNLSGAMKKFYICYLK